MSLDCIYQNISFNYSPFSHQITYTITMGNSNDVLKRKFCFNRHVRLNDEIKSHIDSQNI
jgi:hypothetical protein